MMFKKAVENIKKYNLIKTNDDILCALSGGPDSVYLLYTLLEAREEISFNLSVASVHHGLRKEAKEEVEFCRKLAEDKGLKFYTKRVDMRGFSKREKISLEDAGRRLRYEYFYSLIGDNGKIALGHHLNDQAETILMNLLRGSGLRGLRGMEFKSGQRIRPLLNIEKKEILKTLEEAKISYYLDYTNFEKDFKRNEIRLHLIPEIEENYNPKFQESLVRLGQLAREDDSALEIWAEKEYKKVVKNQLILREDFLKNPLAIQKRILFKIFEKYSDLKDLTFLQINELLNLFEKDISKEKTLKNIQFISTYDGVKFLLEDKQNLKEIELKLGENIFGNTLIEAQLISPDEFFRIEKRGRFFFDGKILEKPIIIRSRKEGDAFKPFGFSGTKRLKEFFIDEKIPKYKRDQIPLITKKDQIYLVGSYRRGEGFLVNKNSENVLMIEMREKE